MSDDVILAPGLWMPASTLWLLAARLQRAGYAPHLFSYSGRGSFDANVERLARFARSRALGWFLRSPWPLAKTLVQELLPRPRR